MTDSDLLYFVEDKIATITLNRPQAMNSLTPKGMEDLHRAFDEADADPSVRVIIMTGSGTSFCAGYDLSGEEDGASRLDPAGQSLAEFLEAWHRSNSATHMKWEHMWRLGKPIIAAVNGWAMGTGFLYQIAADITIASERAVFSQPEVRHISNTTFMFTALCGWKAANRWALTGDHFDAQEALRIGLVNEVVPHDELMNHCRALAQRIALVPEPSVRLNKAVAMQGMQAAGLHSGMLVNGLLSTLVHTSHNEFRESLFEAQRKDGMKAYLNLRDGPFQPEPMGPRSAKARAERERLKDKQK